MTERRRCQRDSLRFPWICRGISKVEEEIPKPKLEKCPVKAGTLMPGWIYGAVVPKRGARGINKGGLK